MVEGMHGAKYYTDESTFNVRITKKDGKTFFLPKQDIVALAVQIVAEGVTLSQIKKMIGRSR